MSINILILSLQLKKNIYIYTPIIFTEGSRQQETALEVHFNTFAVSFQKQFIFWGSVVRIYF